MRRHRLPENKKVFMTKNVFCLFRQTKFGMGKKETLERKLLQYFLAENPMKFNRNW